MFKLVLEKAEESEIKLPTSAESSKIQEISRTTHLFLLYLLCQSLCVAHNKLWKILKQMGIPHHLTCLLRNLYKGQEATVRTRCGTKDWFQTGKGICQECILLSLLYYHPAYLNSMQNTSCKMLDWMKHKLDSRLLGGIPITPDMRKHYPYGRK